MNFELHDANGQVYTEAILENAPKPPDGEIVTGDKLMGTLTYDVPKAKDLRLYFKPSVYGAQQFIIDLGVH